VASEFQDRGFRKQPKCLRGRQKLWRVLRLAISATDAIATIRGAAREAETAATSPSGIHSAGAALGTTRKCDGDPRELARDYTKP
jgi:hypothetical protein